MNGIPDAVVEAAAETLLTRNGHRWGASKRWDNFYRDLARAALAAAEGPWREHLAAQIEAATLNVDRVLAERAERMVALMDVKHQIVSIVRGTNE